MPGFTRSLSILFGRDFMLPRFSVLRVSPVFFPLLFSLVFPFSFSIPLVHAVPAKLTPSDGRPDDAFGGAAAIHDGTVLIGAPGDDGDGTDAGAATVYIQVGANWVSQARLTPVDGGPHRFFGSGVDLSGDRAAVGAPHGDGRTWGTGAAYVFERVGNSWAQAAWLRASDGERNDAFGRSVALDGDTAAVGAHRDGDRGAESGAVYLFEAGGAAWTQAAKLVPADGGPGDHFGWALSLSGDVLAVGAPHRDGIGAVYVFRRTSSGWRQEATLTAPSGAEGDFFGFSTAIDGSAVLVGVPGSDVRGLDSGAVFAFSETGGVWTVSATLPRDSGAAGDRFGRSVSLSNGWAAAGADGSDGGGLSAGQGFLFREEAGGWRTVSETDAREGEAGDRIGWPVAVHGDEDACVAVFGARGDDAVGENAGAAYLLNYPNPGDGAPDIQVAPRTLILSSTSAPVQSFGDDPAPPPPPADADGPATGLVIPDSVLDYWRENPRPPGASERNSLPARMDWSAFDSPIRSQGSCGSCSAFAAAALIENLMNRAGLPVLADISEQTFLACAPLTCAGGWYWDALEYAAEFGVPPESCYPYEERTGSCFLRCDDPEYLVRLVRFTPSPGLWGEDQTVDDLRAALQEGPLIVSMRVPNDNTFAGSAYRGGVYDYDGDFITWEGNGHAVLLVGYDDATQSFKVKNSWGADWGESGYFRIAYDDVADDVRFGGYGVTASLPFLTGRMGAVTVSNPGGQPLTVTDIRADVPWLDVSPAGGFSVAPGGHAAATFRVTDWERVSRPGETALVTIYSNDPDEATVTISVTAQHAQPGSVPSVPVSPGDLDGRDGATLADAVLGLRILSGGEGDGLVSDYPNSGADVDGDGRVGFVEVLYVLRSAAGIR